MCLRMEEWQEKGVQDVAASVTDVCESETLLGSSFVFGLPDDGKIRNSFCCLKPIREQVAEVFKIHRCGKSPSWPNLSR